MTPSQFEGLYSLIREMPITHTAQPQNDAQTVGLTTNAIQSKRTEKLSKAERQENFKVQLILNGKRRREAMELDADYYAAIGLAA